MGFYIIATFGPSELLRIGWGESRTENETRKAKKNYELNLKVLCKQRIDFKESRNKLLWSRHRFSKPKTPNICFLKELFTKQSKLNDQLHPNNFTNWIIYSANPQKHWHKFTTLLTCMQTGTSVDL